MKRFWLPLVALGASGCFLLPKAHEEPRTLPERLDALLGPFEAGGDIVSALVVDASTGARLYSHREHTRSLPASTMKLSTTAAGLALLGPDYRFKTPISLQGSQVDSVFSGDVVIGAAGDPSFGAQRFVSTAAVCDRVAEKMVARGIKRWTGNVRVYENGDNDASLGPGWAWDDSAYDYSAPPLPFVFRENAARLLVVRAPAERCESDISSVFESVTGGYTADVREDTEASEDGLECRRRGTARTFQCIWHRPADVCPHSVSARLSLGDPVAAFRSCLDKALAEVGVESGVVAVGERRHHERKGEIEAEPGTLPPNLLYEAESPRLADLIRATNKESLNIYAERIGLEVARKATGSGTYAALRETLAQDHRDRNIDPRDLVQVDGSGLSRYNLATATALVQILYTSLQAPYGEVLLNSLPIAGVDGTLSQHRLSAEATGHVRAKTGTLSGQRAFVGLAERANDVEHPKVLFALLMGNLARPVVTTNETFDRLAEILVSAPLR
jgi:D-alanyl-D-alanine carboxypeptidase/D-alanyl-D-alanine-endopeptidase (penicillin-binding protein 4)